MIKKCFLILLFTTSLVFISATEGRGNNLSLGFTLTDSQNNFGIQGEVTSPRFVYDIFAIRAHGGMEFASAEVFNGSDKLWDRFYSARIGVLAGAGCVSEVIRLYGEFGGLFLFAEDITGDVINPGIYGLFGFEFYNSPSVTYSPITYFIELGSSGVNVDIEGAGDNMSFYNGFKIATGFRYYL